MDSNFDIEIWQDSGKLKRILLYIVLITLIAWACCLIGQIYWDDYVQTTTTLRGKTKYVGWPVKLYYYGMFIGIAGLISFIILMLNKNKKYPVLAVNHSGLFINQQLIKQTTVPWTNIKQINLINDGKNKTLEIHFKDVNKIIEGQSSGKKAFLKENLKDGKPLVCTDKFTKGNLGLLYEKSQLYLS